MNDAEHQTEGLGDTFPRREGAESVSSLHEGELLLDRFKLVRLVGRGGMGEVYEARDLRLHTTVALKTVRASAASVEGLLERLRREVQLARGVTHPNVCRVFDFHEGPGPEGKPVAFVTMEFLDGETLAERLRAGGPFAPRDALPLLEQMAEGLASIHARRLVHRDFKPGNVMLVRTENQVRAVVTDLGIARVVGGGEADTGWLGTEAGAVVGSPAYMAPEQRRGAEVTARSDVHALALVACEMVSGQRPLESGVLNGVPRAWASALGRALDPDPERRPADPRALVAILEGRKRRRRELAAALALAVLLVLTGGVIAWRRSATSTIADRRSIAVLPLANLGGSPDDDYFGEGLAEDINTQLTKVRALHVVSRASTRPLKGTARPVRENRSGAGGRHAPRGNHPASRRPDAHHGPAGRRPHRPPAVGGDIRPGHPGRAGRPDRCGLEGRGSLGPAAHRGRGGEAPPRRDVQPGGVRLLPPRHREGGRGLGRRR